jgi:hypothetical protein
VTVDLIYWDMAPWTPPPPGVFVTLENAGLGDARGLTVAAHHGSLGGWQGLFYKWVPIRQLLNKVQHGIAVFRARYNRIGRHPSPLHS